MKYARLLLACAPVTASAVYAQAVIPVSFCEGRNPCQGKNRRVWNIQILQQLGARPRFSPDGQFIVFDKPNAGGYSDVYIMKLDGRIEASLTENNNPGIPQKHNGNAVFDPSGQFVIFVSEAEEHIQASPFFSDSGIGLFSNLWATNRNGTQQFWKLTDVPIKQTIADGIPYYAVTNPLFSNDGKTLVWTERYDGEAGAWGKWRIKAGEFSVQGGQPVLTNTRVLYTPETGNYVTVMGFEAPTRLLVAGNLNGQNVFGMDEYIVNLATGAVLNLTNTPSFWEEGASVAPNDLIIYMSNKDSQLQFNSDTAWQLQPITREYYLTDPNAKMTERLTYFNDPTAPEYIGRLVAPVALDISPDGNYAAATLGVDVGAGSVSNRQLKIALLQLQPLYVGSVSSANFAPMAAPEAILAAFGSDVASGQEQAKSLPLPTTLAGTSVTVTDSAGNSQLAPLFFVSPTQVNYEVPAGLAPGPATVIFQNAAGVQVRSNIQIQNVAPALYAATGTGKGAAAAYVLTLRSNGSQTSTLTATYSSGAWKTNPVSLGSAADQAFLVLYGTGIRYRSSLSAVTATIGNQTIQASYAGSAGIGFAGLDQVNVSLPKNLAGASLVDVRLTVDGVATNTVQIQIQ